MNLAETNGFFWTMGKIQLPQTILGLFFTATILIACTSGDDTAIDPLSTQPWDEATIHREFTVFIEAQTEEKIINESSYGLAAITLNIPDDKLAKEENSQGSKESQPSARRNDPQLNDPSSIKLKVLEADYSKGADDKSTPGSDYLQFAIIPDGKDINDSESKSPKDDFNEMNIKVRVSIRWLEENNVKPSEISLWQYEGGWVQLPTELTEITDEMAVYEAPGFGFSRYAVTATDPKVDQKDNSPVEFSTLPRRIPVKDPLYSSIPIEIKGYEFVSSSGKSGELLQLGQKESDVTLNLFLEPKREIHGEVTVQIYSHQTSFDDIREHTCSERIAFNISERQLFLCSFETNELGGSGDSEYLYFTTTWNGVVFFDSRPAGRVTFQ